MKKLLLISLMLSLVFTAFGQENDTTMTVTDINDVEIKKTPHNVDVRLIYDKKDAQAVHIELKAGESLKQHITPVDVFFYILEGEATIMIGDEKKVVQKDNIVESPKNIVHCIYNESNDKVRVLVVKTPRQKEKSRIL